LFGQREQVLPSTVGVMPGAHATHAELPAGACSSVRHGTHADALAGERLPAPHGVHWAALTAPNPGWYVPAGHGVQTSESKPE
jgi:hypothetical protein